MNLRREFCTTTPVLLTLTSLAFLILPVLVVHRSRHKKRHHVPLANLVASVEHQLDPAGTIMVEGELWRAQSVTGETITSRQSVVIVGTEGPVLLVKPV